MLSVCRDGGDPYKAFAAIIGNKDYESVTKPERTQAKPAVLGCGYGSTLLRTPGPSMA